MIKKNVFSNEWTKNKYDKRNKQFRDGNECTSDL